MFVAVEFITCTLCTVSMLCVYLAVHQQDMADTMPYDDNATFDNSSMNESPYFVHEPSSNSSMNKSTRVIIVASVPFYSVII